MESPTKKTNAAGKQTASKRPPVKRSKTSPNKKKPDAPTQTKEASEIPRKETTSPSKSGTKGKASPVKRRDHLRAYSSPAKKPPQFYIKSRELCRYFQQGVCKNGDECRWSHEKPNEVDFAVAETPANTANDRSSFTYNILARPDVGPYYYTGFYGNFSRDHGTAGHQVDTQHQRQQQQGQQTLNADVSRILATNVQVNTTDEDSFFTELDHINSQAFTDHQIHGKLTEDTASRLLQHTFVVQSAANDAMRLAYHTGHAEDYERANALDELAKSMMATPGLQLEDKTKDSVLKVAMKTRE